MDKKFIKTKILQDLDLEVLTDDGWVDIKAIHKTIEYDEWVLITQTCELICADTHIVFDENMNEVFVKDLVSGDKIQTKNGVEVVCKCYKDIHDKKSNMYDLELSDDSKFRYFTNDILSHNTYFLRYLLQKLTQINKKVLYFPPTMVDTITDPSFFNFITDWTIENGKRTILLIEDAEPLLASRNNTRNLGITNLLNLTDGILNDILSIQIIATFNTDLSELDDALLRPERLIARKEFTNLTIKQSKAIADKLKLDSNKINKEMSLAEIYAMKKNKEIMNHGMKPTKSIGFKMNN